MTRDEHLAWCKRRALQSVDAGKLADAITAMEIDMSKHPELGINDFLMMLGMKHVIDHDARAVRQWIEGFR